jgi:hypothetical protein
MLGGFVTTSGFQVERSTLIMANTIHQASVQDMVTSSDYERLEQANPELVGQLPRALCEA